MKDTATVTLNGAGSKCASLEIKSKQKMLTVVALLSSHRMSLQGNYKRVFTKHPACTGSFKTISRHRYHGHMLAFKYEVFLSGFCTI